MWVKLLYCSNNQIVRTYSIPFHITSPGRNKWEHRKTLWTSFDPAAKSFWILEWQAEEENKQTNKKYIFSFCLAQVCRIRTSRESFNLCKDNGKKNCRAKCGAQKLWWQRLLIQQMPFLSGFSRLLWAFYPQNPSFPDTLHSLRGRDQ